MVTGGGICAEECQIVTKKELISHMFRDLWVLWWCWTGMTIWEDKISFMWKLSVKNILCFPIVRQTQTKSPIGSRVNTNIITIQIAEHKSKRNTNTKAQAICPTTAALTLVRGWSNSSLLRNARLGYARYCRFSIKHLNHNDSQCLCMTIRFWYPQHQQKPESSILDIFISHIIQVYQSFWWKPRGRAIIFCCWAG